MDKHTWNIIRIALKEAIPLPAIKAFIEVLEYEENTVFQNEVIKYLESINENAELIQTCLKNTEEIKKELKQFRYILIDDKLKKDLNEISKSLPPLQTPHILYVLSQYNIVKEFYSSFRESLNDDICNDLESYIIERPNDYIHQVNLLEHPVVKMAQYYAILTDHTVINEMDLLLGAYLLRSKTIQILEDKYFHEYSHYLIIEKLKEYCERSHTIVATDENIFHTK